MTVNKQPVKYYLDKNYRFIIENYNWAKPFSNFFPGIGGKWGVPMWIYYVNRAQCISSMGVRDKDHAILEFYSFNKALQLVGQQGFRTFIKIDNRTLYEPFQKSEDEKIRQRMVVSSEELEIGDFNPRLGIETRVRYFPLVGEPLAAFVRELRIKNIETHRLNLELIDGLPRVLPYGVNQNHVKFIARHIEGMMGVDQLEGIPLFRLKQTPADIPRVEKISGSNFYLSLFDRGGILSNQFIVDPYVVFGESEIYDHPWFFEKNSIQTILSTKQTRENKTPCAFTALRFDLSAGREIVLYSLIGTAPNDEKLRALLKSIKKRNFFRRKSEENRRIIDEIKNHAFTVSSSPEFDQYCQQTFLDNVLRGGMPLVFQGTKKKHVFYLYGRMHGDLERDYHYFILEPTYLSQGTGFYRDLLQNRRMDVWFFPEIQEFILITFLNLLQTDGYNPQLIRGFTYTVENSGKLRKLLKDIGDKKLRQELSEMLSGSFTPGEFIMKLEEEKIRGPQERERILADVLELCRQNDVGDLHEGFWVDHWTYNLDSLESFLAIYPEKLKEILIERRIFTFYDNPDIVLPRNMKYVLIDGKIRQYGAVTRDSEKLKMIKSRPEYPTRVRTKYGYGVVYKTNLLVKLLCVVANKIATLDPRGIGIEMEADKPGWNDSINGLPGLLGSSLCETVELGRLCRFLRESLDRIKLKDSMAVRVYEELHEFIVGLNHAIEKRLNSKKEDPLLYWEESNRLKERYREKTKMGISGQELKMTVSEVKIFLDRCLRLLGEIFKPKNKRKILHENGVPYTYFINEVSEYEQIWADKGKRIPLTNPSGQPLVKAKNFRSRPVALFLEGPVHMLRVHPEWRKQIYRAVKKSGIYDRKLKMYKSCESLKGEPFEIGRVRAYASGWIENESVYLHMEYKWLLEVLRGGLYGEFYKDIKTALVPFLNPKVYGRSVLEGGSFIVSSAFPDEKLHGQGFQPRLSGATGEMLHIWTLMAAGKKPFSLNGDGELTLRLQPILPGWLFTKQAKLHRYYDKDGKVKMVMIPENAFAFKFLGRGLVVYHNPRRKNTFGEDRAKVVSYQLKYGDGKKKTVPGDILKAPLASDVREGRVERIDVVLR
jgi:hypothetical protein